MKKILALLMAALLAVTTLGCGIVQEPGKVCYLNCIPEANEAWQKLATAYSDIYGVEVTVRTVTGEDCAATVRAALSREDAPTAFQFYDASDFDQLKEYCTDLTGSAVLSQMITGSFNLTDGGAVKAVSFSYDAFGLMVNTSLLKTAGYELEDIQDFDALRAVAEDIHSRRDTLQFDAFCALTAESAAVLPLADLAQLYKDEGGLYLVRRTLDLYLDNCTASRTKSSVADATLDQFAQAQAVFCPYSASGYDVLVAGAYDMIAEDLAMIPLRFGAQGEESNALSCTPRNYWAINAQSTEADRKATADFLNWVVTSEYGISVLQEQFGGVPFKAADETGFFGDSNALLAQGNAPVVLTDKADEANRAAIVAAVANYATNRNDENWNKIKEALGTDPA